jgi:CubicO group peptidase (beta-lactamase class C family)
MRFAGGVLVALLLWVVVAGMGWLNGWGRRPLAEPGDTTAFMAALTQEVEATRKGNVGLALIEAGRLHGEHMSSVGAPVERDTAFQVASLSKGISAWGVMALVSEGRLDLDAPVSQYLTRWQLPGSAFDNEEVTVRRLLSHTAGLTDGLGYAGVEAGSPIQSLEDSLSRAADASPGASGITRVGIPPGQEFRYSGGGYTLLQLIIEEVSGESFEDYMQRAVFEPLGMHDSTFVWRDAPGSKLAGFFDVDSSEAVHYRFTSLAATSLYTTVGDMVRFLQAHLEGPAGELAGRGILSAAALAEMREPHASQLGADIWGLGTILYAPNGAGGHVIGHDGNNEPAINTAVRVNPATGNGIVILETGNRLLATRLAGEWVFWETGYPGVLTLIMETGEVIELVAIGSFAILLGAAVLAWRMRQTA